MRRLMKKVDPRECCSILYCLWLILFLLCHDPDVVQKMSRKCFVSETQISNFGKEITNGPRNRQDERKMDFWRKMMMPSPARRRDPSPVSPEARLEGYKRCWGALQVFYSPEPHTNSIMCRNHGQHYAILMQSSIQLPFKISSSSTSTD
jgi:hypothetical protein